MIKSYESVELSEEFKTSNNDYESDLQKFIENVSLETIKIE